MDYGATHMLVVCDTFDYEDYPVYVMPAQDAATEKNRVDNQNMQKVMEVYDLRQDRDKQLDMPIAMAV